MRRWVHVVSIAAAIGMAVPPGVDEALQRVQTLSREMAGAMPERRPVVLAELIRARDELLALGRDDDRAATWLLDQAESVLQQASADGAELSVLYGIPSAEQRRRMRDAAVSAADLVERAARAAEEGVARLESELFAARGDAARAKEVSQRVEPRLKVLADVELAYRVPLYRARTALAVAATLESGSEKQRAAGRTVAAVLAEARGPSAAAEVQRLVLDATARFLAGEPDAAQRFAELEPSAGTGILGEQTRLGQAAAAPDAVAAREAVRRLRTSEDVPLALELLRAEVAARALMSAKASEAVPVREALEMMERVVARSLAPEVDESMRSLVVEKAAEAAARAPLSELAEAMRFARGAAMVTGNIAEGIDALQRLAADPATSGGVKEAALWTIGVGGTPASRWERSARALVQLAREHASSARAGDALWRAESLVRAGAERSDPKALELQREVIELLLARRDERAAALRSVYVSNVARDERAVVRDSARLAQLLDMVLSSPLQPPAEREADELNAMVVIRRALDQADASTRVEMGKTAAAWAEKRAPGRVHGLRLALGVALLDAGRAAEAVETIGAIGRLDQATLTDAERTTARLTLGRAQRRAGRSEEAFTTLRPLADELDHPPASPSEGKRPAAFWAAWAEMLEILEAQNADGARTPTIRLQVNRLKLIDAGLGSGATRERISGVESRLK